MRVSVWSLVAAMLVASAASAATVQVRVMVENLSPTNSAAFAPLRVGFNNGTYDAFNINTTPTAPIISIAEGGSGSAWFPAFMAAQPERHARHGRSFAGGTARSGRHGVR